MHRAYLADLPPQLQKATRLAQAGRLIAFGLLLSCTNGVAGPSAFTWTDANGQVHFGDKPPQDSAAKQVDIRVNTYSAPVNQPGENDTAAVNQDIILYTTQQCGYCRKTRAFLASHGLSYTEYDVESSARGRADYKKLKGRGVPIILVGEQRMNGFSETELTTLLRNAGYNL